MVWVFSWEGFYIPTALAYHIPCRGVKPLPPPNRAGPSRFSAPQAHHYSASAAALPLPLHYIAQAEQLFAAHHMDDDNVLPAQPVE